MEGGALCKGPKDKARSAWVSDGPACCVGLAVFSGLLPPPLFSWPHVASPKLTGKNTALQIIWVIMEVGTDPKQASAAVDADPLQPLSTFLLPLHARLPTVHRIFLGLLPAAPQHKQLGKARAAGFQGRQASRWKARAGPGRAGLPGHGARQVGRSSEGRGEAAGRGGSGRSSSTGRKISAAPRPGGLKAQRSRAEYLAGNQEPSPVSARARTSQRFPARAWAEAPFTDGLTNAPAAARVCFPPFSSGQELHDCEVRFRSPAPTRRAPGLVCSPTADGKERNRLTLRQDEAGCAPRRGERGCRATARRAGRPGLRGAPLGPRGVGGPRSGRAPSSLGGRRERPPQGQRPSKSRR
ncbi:PREDICTED: translation initiation factor IF-2-like, partial [Chinchilla lanigera]|uniref:translation initiation factor IF-2-like n=1 Tax=Chinchilla lanigera TaxID=34839 RepID=UPI0006972F7C